MRELIAITETAPRRNPRGLDGPAAPTDSRRRSPATRRRARGRCLAAARVALARRNPPLHENKASVVAAIAFVVLLAFVIFVPW